MRVDTGLRHVLVRNEDPWTEGFAAVPGTLDKRLDDLADETALYVDCRGSEPISVISEALQVGGSIAEGSAVVITAKNVRAGDWPRRRGLVEAGIRLDHQGALAPSKE